MRIVQPVIEQLKAQSHPVCHYIYDLVGLEHHFATYYIVIAE